MTISVKLFIPAGKRAKVTTNGQSAYYDATGDGHEINVGCVHGDVDMNISEEDALPTEIDGGTATPQGGGNGTPPPKPPKPGDE